MGSLRCVLQCSSEKQFYQNKSLGKEFLHWSALKQIEPGAGWTWRISQSISRGVWDEYMVALCSVSMSWWLWDSFMGRNGQRGKIRLKVNSFFSPFEWLELRFPFSKGWSNFEVILDLTAWVNSWESVSSSPKIEVSECESSQVSLLCLEAWEILQTWVGSSETTLLQGLSSSVWVRSTEWKAPTC